LGGVPHWLSQHEFASILFARFELPFPRGELPSRYLPFGPNFMVRKSTISDLLFRTDLGPSESSGPLMGEDSEFLCDLRRKMGSATPAKFIYIPVASVSHTIEKVRTEPKMMWERFFSYGRTHIARRRSIGALSPEFGLRLRHGAPRDAKEAFERAAEINFYLGQLYEATLRREDSLASHLRCLLNPSLVQHMQELLGPSAQEHALLLCGRPVFGGSSNSTVTLEHTLFQQ
jgi:hypothetical protein